MKLLSEGWKAIWYCIKKSRGSSTTWTREWFSHHVQSSSGTSEKSSELKSKICKKSKLAKQTKQLIQNKRWQLNQPKTPAALIIYQITMKMSLTSNIHNTLTMKWTTTKNNRLPNKSLSRKTVNSAKKTKTEGIKALKTFKWALEALKKLLIKTSLYTCAGFLLAAIRLCEPLTIKTTT